MNIRTTLGITNGFLWLNAVAPECFNGCGAKMRNARAHFVAKLTRLYPFLSGCGTLANSKAVDWVAGRPRTEAWANVEGGRLLVSLHDHVGRSAFYVGDLDRKISAVIDKFVHPGDVVVDIGANIGLVSLRLANRVGPHGIVHAFEPNPKVAQAFRTSLEANRIGNVVLHEVALGEKEGRLPLSIPRENAGMASLLHTAGPGETVEVPVKRLDNFNLGRVSFIKMDVEGFEESVIRGFPKTLAAEPPRVIVFEQNHGDSGSIRLLTEAGYTIRGVAKSFVRLVLVPVDRWSSSFHDYVAIHQNSGNHELTGLM